MKTVFISNKECNKHVNPIGHPEQVLRLKTIINTLNSDSFSNLHKIKAKRGSFQDVISLHSQDHLDLIIEKSTHLEQSNLDADTVVNRDSLPAALYGIGAIKQAIDLVVSSEAKNAFCATRPPGHHAERSKAMGFCIFGNVAIGAKYALSHKSIRKVAIFDFDVHHGNGTQNLIWNEKNIFFISSHQMPLFPGSGYPDENGAFNNVLNVPLTSGTDGSHYLRIMDEIILPKIENFNPDIILLSAGFDAHKNDPLANLNWLSEDYYKITQKMCFVAEKLCKKRMVSSLEGGYNLSALGESVAFHVKALMEG